MIRLDINYAKQLVLHWSHLYRCYSEQLTEQMRDAPLSCDSLFLRLSYTRRNCPLLSFPEHKNWNGHPACIFDFSSATSLPFSLSFFFFFLLKVMSPSQFRPPILHSRSFQTEKSYWNQHSSLCVVASTPDQTHVCVWSSLYFAAMIYLPYALTFQYLRYSQHVALLSVRAPILMLTRRFYRKVQLTFKHNLQLVWL